MRNIREYIGYWWLPDNENDRLYGSLKIYDDNKLELKVLGMFGGLEEHRNHISINTINGLELFLLKEKFIMKRNLF